MAVSSDKWYTETLVHSKTKFMTFNDYLCKTNCEVILKMYFLLEHIKKRDMK